MNWLLAIGVLALYFTFMGRIVVRQSRLSRAIKQRSSEIFSGRRSLSAQEFAERFFPRSERRVAMFIREQLEPALIVDATKLRPLDHLFSDLRFAQIDGLEANVLELSVRREFGVLLRPLFERVDDPTVGQVVEFVAAEVSA